MYMEQNPRSRLESLHQEQLYLEVKSRAPEPWPILSWDPFTKEYWQSVNVGTVNKNATTDLPPATFSSCSFVRFKDLWI